MRPKHSERNKAPKDLAKPLLEAAAAGNVRRAQELLSHGAQPDRRVTGQPTPLIVAATGGHREVIQALLAGGADVNFEHGGKLGTTALLEAIRHRQFEIACDLVDAGAESSHDWSGQGQNIAYEAIEACNEIKREAAAPARVRRFGPFNKGRTAAARATAGRQLPVAIKLVEKILKAGGRPARPCLPAAAAAGNLSVVRLLLAHGADANETDGSPALGYALDPERIDIALELLQAGADPNLGSALMGPPFHTAVVGGNTKLVKAFVASGKDLNCRATVTLNEPVEKPRGEQKEGPRLVLNLGEEYVEMAEAHDSTPLIVAVRAGHSAIVRVLAQGGVDLEAEDRDGFTALAWAQKRNRKDLTTLLKRAGARIPKPAAVSPRSLYLACEAGDVDRAQAAIAAGADVNEARETTRELFTPLMAAARGGHSAMVELLLRAGANPNLGGREQAFLIVGPLMLAARHGHAAIVQQLLDAGVATAAPGRCLFQLRERGDTAIHEAARNGHAKVVALFLQAGLDVKERSEWSGTVLESAVESGNLETVKVILAAGAKPGPGKVKELLTEAMASEHWDIVRELHALR